MVTACCSAMPTSKKRLGKRSREAGSPVPVGIPAVMAQIRSSASARRTSSSTKVWVYVFGLRCGADSAGSGSSVGSIRLRSIGGRLAPWKLTLSSSAGA